ncbi:MAG: hypothetical protein ACI4JC_02750 [Faecalibacterium sp.]
MNITAFIEYLNENKHWHLDAAYYGHIEEWRQWWQGNVPGVHTVPVRQEDGSRRTRRRASLRMPKRVCEDWANLLLNDQTTFQIGDAKTADYLLGRDEQQTGGLLRRLHFWENANKLVEKAYWSGTGAFVMSVEGVSGADGALQPNPAGRIRLDYDPASCILPIRVERGIVVDAAFVSECTRDGKPCAYLQTHTCKGEMRIIRNEWFEIGEEPGGAPRFTPLDPPDGTVAELKVPGSPAWFSLFSPAAVKNIDGGTGLGVSVFAEAIDAAAGIDLAFDNYREDIRLGHKKIFYSTSICRAEIGPDGLPVYIPPDDDVKSQFVTLPGKEGSIDLPAEWHEHNPDLRTEQNHQAVQDMLNLFSFRCGLGCHRYSFELGKISTATEYNGSRQDLVQSANKNQIPIETALIGILRAILWAAKNLLGADVDPDTSISVNWDDSYITDQETRINQLRDDALSGLVPRFRYLCARYGLSEDEARRWAEEAKADGRTDEMLTFGGA